MHQLMFSVIVPVFNSEEYIEKTIMSLLNINYDNYEIILVNDGSTDNTIDILNKYSTNSKVRILSKPNGGIYSARNSGISVAKGDYILFSDQDDCVSEKSMKHFQNVIVNNQEPDVVCANALICKEGKVFPYIEIEDTFINKKIEREEIIKHLFYPMATSGLSNLSGVQAQNILSVVWNKAFKRKFVEENDILFQKPLAFEDDHIFCLACFSRANSVYFLNENVYTWIVHNDSESHRWKTIPDCFDRIFDLNDYYENFILPKIDVDENKKIKIMSKKWLWSIKFFLSNEMYNDCSKSEKIKNIKKIDISFIKDFSVVKTPFERFIIFCLKLHLYRLLLFVVCRTGITI